MADIQPFVDKGLIDPSAGGMNTLGGGGGGFGDFLSNNSGLFGALAGGAGGALGMFLGNNQALPFQDQMSGVAGQLGGEAAGLYGYGNTLMNPLISGKLPPGAEQSVQNAIKQATDTSKARFASLGQTGSTMEGDTLANIQNQATQMRFQIAENMAQTGLKATEESIQALGLEGKMYGDMMQAQMKQDSQMSDTIGKFASSLGGMLAKAAPALLMA